MMMMMVRCKHHVSVFVVNLSFYSQTAKYRSFPSVSLLSTLSNLPYFHSSHNLRVSQLRCSLCPFHTNTRSLSSTSEQTFIHKHGVYLRVQALKEPCSLCPLSLQVLCPVPAPLHRSSVLQLGAMKEEADPHIDWTLLFHL